MERASATVTRVARSVHMEGRRDELRRIGAVLESVAGHASVSGADGTAATPAAGRVVVIHGEAGIGKTTLIDAVSARADDDGWRIWTTRPTAAEASFPWVAVAQLIDDVAPDDMRALVAAHAATLRAVLAPSDELPVAPERVAFALAALFDTATTAAAPLLIVVDDMHWLDPSSAGAMAYALRGVPARRCVVLIGIRSGESLPLEVERLVPAGVLEHLELHGLPVGSLREAIRHATGQALGRAHTAQLHQYTRGNPLYAIELLRTGEGRPVGSPTGVSVPPSLREAMRSRLAALPAPTRVALAAAALAERPDLDLLAAALAEHGIGDVLTTLAAAEDLGIISIERDSAGRQTVRFDHPLQAAAAVDVLSSADRRGIHAALAHNIDDVVWRAPHLIATAVGRSAALADELDAAAREARRRGAVDAAVAFARAAIATTPQDRPTVELLARRCTLAELEFAASDMAAARATIAPLLDGFDELAALDAAGEQWSSDVPTAEVGSLQERAWTVYAEATSYLDPGETSIIAFEQALRVVASPARRVRLQAAVIREHIHSSATAALLAAEAELGDPTRYDGDLAIVAAGHLARVRVLAGQPADLDALLARIAEQPDPERRYVLGLSLFNVLLVDDHPAGVALTEKLIVEAERRGDRTRQLSCLLSLPRAYLSRGQWDRAADACKVALELDPGMEVAWHVLAEQAVLDAAAGDAAAATRHLDRLRRRVADERDVYTRGVLLVAQGQVAQALGDSAAVDHFAELVALAAAGGFRGVRFLLVRRDHIEALVAAGRLDEATDAVASLEADAALNGTAPALADANAAAAVVAAARGDYELARQRFAAAIAAQREFGLGYEWARTKLAAGAAARRAGWRTEAAEHLELARQRFDEMGASQWARRCADELDRVRPRGRSVQVDADGLTATERRIAVLAASGRSNAEIAAALFISVRTVESNLTRVFRKLDVRSRTELARRFTPA